MRLGTESLTYTNGLNHEIVLHQLSNNRLQSSSLVRGDRICHCGREMCGSLVAMCGAESVKVRLDKERRSYPRVGRGYILLEAIETSLYGEGIVTMWTLLLYKQ